MLALLKVIGVFNNNIILYVMMQLYLLMVTLGDTLT